MSFFNSPPLVTAAGIATAAGLPYLEKWCATAPFAYVQLVQAIAYVCNVLATATPGRIDGQVAQKQNMNQNKEEGKELSESDKISNNYLADRRGKTLVAPAGWTFGIWGPIFMGEMAYCVASYFLEKIVPNSAAMIPMIRSVAGSFIASQIFQVLWCFSFRPSYKTWTDKSGHKLWLFLSSFMLSGIAICLNRSHMLLSNFNVTGLSYWLFFAPLTAHFGWTTAAALVNLNGDYTLVKKATSKNIVLLGHASAILATAVGVGLTYMRQAPLLGGVVGWALLGCSHGMVRRVSDATRNKDADNNSMVKDADLMAGAKRQRWLCLVGSIASFVAAGLSYKMRFDSNKQKIL